MRVGRKERLMAAIRSSAHGYVGRSLRVLSGGCALSLPSDCHCDKPQGRIGFSLLDGHVLCLKP